jgi:hypothetical protein
MLDEYFAIQINESGELCTLYGASSLHPPLIVATNFHRTVPVERQYLPSCSHNHHYTP